MKRFLVIFRLPELRAEHAKLKSDLERYSTTPPQIVFAHVDRYGESMTAYLFKTHLPLRELTFDQHLLRGDTHLLMEVGEICAAEGFGDVMRWLASTRPL
jgi:hypothetical protein